MAGYFHYFSFGLSRYIDGLLLRVRDEVFQHFMTSFAPGAEDSILDIGVSADDHIASNYFEKHYPYPGRICALGIDHLPDLPRQFPGLRVVQGDARILPFADGSFDFVYSHAVIEHLGNREQQGQFLREAMRVARHGVLVTTPNRWHPMESHTGLPVLHYLPARVYRPVYRATGKGMYASEETLNLLSAGNLLGLAPAGERTLYRVRWLGIASNLVLVLRKD
jgi:hypothetical protein